MKKNRFSAFLAITAAAVMAVSGALPAFAAAAYTPVEGTETTFKKYLIMEAGARVPNVTFSYSVTPGAARSESTSDNSVMQVLPGIGTPKISSTAFKPGDATAASLQTGDIDVARKAASRGSGLTAQTGVEFEPAKGEKYAVQTATVDFSGIRFSEPGIYRYIIAETVSAQDEAKGIMHDNDTDRVLDVYVTDDGNGALKVSSYVLHTEDADVKIGSNMGSNDTGSTSKAQPAGEPLEDKTDGFTNEYKANDLTFKMEVSGNTAATIPANAGKTNVTELTVSSDGTVEQTFYLQHGQSIAVRSLPLNAAYDVSENEEDYLAKESALEGFKDPVRGTTEKDVLTSYLNIRDGVIPTGVPLALLPGLGAVAAGGAGLALFAIRRRHRRG